MKTALKIILMIVLLAVIIQLAGMIFFERDFAQEIFQTVFDSSGESSEGPGLSDPEESVQETDTVVQIAPYGSSYYEKTEQRAGYSQLDSDAMRTLYNLIREKAFHVSVSSDDNGYYSMDRVRVDGKLTGDEIRKTVAVFRGENPDFFWLANVYSYGYTENATYLQLYSYVSAARCNTMIPKLNSRIDEILSGLQGGASDFDRELFLYEALAERCSYAENSSEENWQAYTSYGALVNGQAVCEGYSRAMQQLLSYVGIPCLTVNGRAGGVLHMWNLVQLGTAFYHLDATWSDSDELVSYRYFNLTDTQILQDHTVFPSFSEKLSEGEVANLSLPECTAGDAEYYSTRALRISSLETDYDDSMIAEITVLLKNGQKSVSFYVEEGIAVSDAVKWLISESPYNASYWIREAAKKSGVSVDTSKSVYAVFEDRRGITLKIEYK